jgi:acetoin utilization protein AcuC
MGSDRATLVFDERLISYDFGPSHPLNPVRVALTVQLARELGVLERLDVVSAEPCSDEELAGVHTLAYIDRVVALSADPTQADPSVGLGTSDNPVFGGMHEVGALIGGASVEAARRVWSGQSLRAANIAGGLHHAMPGRASGFCIYNDPALAIRWLLDQGAERVAYVDVDAHHGDGVQEIFYEDPRVLTVSIHEGPQSLFPGTGYATETGGPGAEGSAVNVALPPGTSDAGWLRAFHAVVPHVLRAFGPEILLTQHGCDSHMDDPLTNLMLSVDGQRASYLALESLAEELTGGRWIITGGGGYSLTSVVPRIWTHLLAIVSGAPLDPGTETTSEWRATVEQLTGRPAQQRMTDGRSAAYRDWDLGYDPASWLDRAVQATRTEVFPLLGIDSSV